MKKLSALLVLLATSAASSAQEAKPNTLTPKEIADGWILLFDGDTTFGWKTDGDASVKTGRLMLGKNAKAQMTTAFGSFQLDYEYKSADKQGGSSTINLLSGKDLADNVGLAGDGDNWVHRVDKLEVSPAEWKWSSETKGAAASKTSSNNGRIIIEFRNGEKGGTFLLRNVKLKPLGLKSIFDGKDLTGWKEIPGKKSKFTVNDKGELNIKDGPGDLQTTGEWDDFVLQLDVFSNGKHLNSGVFFRCQPGQFWSGYEAQIRNQWVGDDRTKPVDYGTGGIYNRQPARKVVSSDKEWFTMTVVANGSHMATWVDGYQVTDFTDTRKPNASARNGLKVDKGPISLQGHDPTTDLSFRNIRVVALPARAAEPKK